MNKLIPPSKQVIAAGKRVERENLARHMETADERKVRETNDHALALQIERQHQIGGVL